MDFAIPEKPANRERDRLHLTDHRDARGIGEESQRSPGGVAA